MKQATLEKLQQAEREDAVRFLYLGEAGFHGSPPVQRSWLPRGLPRQVEPNPHRRRSVIGALDFGENTLIHAAHAGTIKAQDVECFIDSVLATGNGLPTVIVLDNASTITVSATRRAYVGCSNIRSSCFTCLPMAPSST